MWTKNKESPEAGYFNSAGPSCLVSSMSEGINMDPHMSEQGAAVGRPLVDDMMLMVHVSMTAGNMKGEALDGSVSDAVQCWSNRSCAGTCFSSLL